MIVQKSQNKNPTTTTGFQNMENDSELSISQDPEINEIKLQQAIAERESIRKRNVVTKDDQVFGIIPLDPSLGEEKC